MASEVDACDAPFPDELLLVTSKSPRSYKMAVEKMAKFFQREMHFDFPQYLASEYSRNYDYPRDVKTDADLRAFLWYENDLFNRGPNEWPIIGAAGFRFKRLKDGDAWVIDWVWMHPYERRRGHLKTAWPFFLSMFGNFRITRPVSASMVKFVRRMQGSESTVQNAT
jgi:hypothetical protein